MLSVKRFISFFLCFKSAEININICLFILLTLKRLNKKLYVGFGIHSIPLLDSVFRNDNDSKKVNSYVLHRLQHNQKLDSSGRFSLHAVRQSRDRRDSVTHRCQ